MSTSSPVPTASFTVDSQLLLELGEHLVPKRSIALAELVKNSYDADATKCTISLENVSKPGGTITVEDDGNGFDFDTFKRAWMRIATTDSIINPYSRKFHRSRTGAKGVGRLACRVLADKLVLESTGTTRSKRLRVTQYVKATFDWKDFRAGSDVTKIPVAYSVKPRGSDAKTGTKLTLQGTRNTWTREDVTELKEDLLTLVSPFPISTGREQGRDPGFQVVLKAPEYGKEEKGLREEFLRAAVATLSGSLNVPGQPFYTLRFRSGKESTFTPDIKFPDIGPTSLKIHFFVYEKPNFAGVPITMSDAQQLGRRQGGVRIYIGGFRIFKYGDFRDDWLQLDRDRARRVTAFELLPEEMTEGLRRPALLTPGNNQLFGVVDISRFNNPNLIVNITRDRLFENKAFEQLRQFVRLGTDWMTVEYVRGRPKRDKPPKEVTPQQLAEVKQTVQENIALLKEKGGDTATQQAVASLDEAVSTILPALEESISKTSMLEVLASSGTMIFVFEHELDFLISTLRELATEIGEMTDPIDHQRLNEVSTKLDTLSSNITDLGQHIGLLTGIESRSKREELAVRGVVDNLITPFKRNLDQYGIEFTNAVVPTARTPEMFLCEFDSILLNILSNSIKSVKKVAHRRIEIRAEASSNSLNLEFLDSGPGVPAELRDEVFEPFVTFSTPDPIFGQGTGLGLSIVKDIVSSYSGEVYFGDPPQGWGACLRIKLPFGDEG